MNSAPSCCAKPCCSELNGCTLKILLFFFLKVRTHIKNKICNSVEFYQSSCFHGIDFISSSLESMFSQEAYKDLSDMISGNRLQDKVQGEEKFTFFIFLLRTLSLTLYQHLSTIIYPSFFPSIHPSPPSIHSPLLPLLIHPSTYPPPSHPLIPSSR